MTHPQYPGPVPPPPAMHWPPPPPKKKSRLPLVLGVVGGFILLACGGGVILAAMTTDQKPVADVQSPNGGSGAIAAQSPQVQPKASAKPSPKAASGLNKPVRDGQFEFVVTKVKCGVAKVGRDYLSKTAQGQYCLVTATVKNIGKQPRTLDDSNQNAYDATGAQYATDEAGFYANKDGEVFLNNINPGNKVTAVFVWDIPKGAKLTKLELHDSAFSGGVEVKLS